TPIGQKKDGSVLSQEENELMTRVGPGTPAGEMLRRYWWPLAFTETLKPKGRPVKVRLLGEDFVVFRDGGGKLGLLDLHCSHRAPCRRLSEHGDEADEDPMGTHQVRNKRDHMG